MPIRKKILYFSAFFFTGVVLFLLIIFINLSGIVEHQVKKRLPEKLTQTGIDFHIRKLGVSNTIISNIYYGKDISVNSVDLSYEINSLLNLDIETLIITGLVVKARLNDKNQLQIDGFDDLDSSEGESKSPDFSLLPEKIVLNQGRLMLSAMGEDYLIPFDALSIIKSDNRRLQIQAKIYPFGQKVNVQIAYSFKKGLEQVFIEGKTFDISYLNSFISNTFLKLEGKTDFKIASSSPTKEWETFFSEISISQPEDISLNSMTTQILLNDKKISILGDSTIITPQISEAGVKYSGDIDLNDNLKFKIKIKKPDKALLKIVHPICNADFEKSDLEMKFSGTSEKILGNISATLESVKLKNSHADLSMSHMNLDKEVAIDLSGDSKNITSNVNLHCKGIQVVSNEIRARLSMLSISGVLNLNEDLRPDGLINIKASGGRITEKNSDFKISGISINTPIALSGDRIKKQGRYSIADISVSALPDQEPLAFSSKGKIKQLDRFSFQFNGEGGYKKLPDLKMKYNSLLTLKDRIKAVLEFEIPPFKLGLSDVENITGPITQNIEMDIKTSVNGKFEYDQGNVQSIVQLEIQDGQVSLPDNNFSASGLNTRLEFLDPIKLRSRPGQVITIDSIMIDKVQMQDARIRFSIENTNSFLIENIMFKWCNGIVSTEAVRFPQEHDKYNITLYCDRLDMIQLLNQLGDFKSKGTGTLSGRIPLVYSRGDIAFDDGFLFTTPGSSGVVAIDNINKYTEGIPMNSPQMSQIDLAQEALKDFNYKWAKIFLKTNGDILSFRLNIDGKPSKILPFRFEKALGGFVRVDPSRPGSDFEGINLDLNLNLPFNEVVKFGNKLQSIFNK